LLGSLTAQPARTNAIKRDERVKRRDFIER
jgi:hypothetical protein